MPGLSKEQIKKYQQLYEQYYGRKISEVESLRQGTALVTFISTIIINIEKKQMRKIKP
jgi:hypothetical protein